MFILLPVISTSQNIITGNPEDVVNAGEGDIFKDTDNNFYIGLEDGTLKQIGTVWKNTSGENASSADTTIAFEKGNIGIGLTTPDNSSILELSSTSQGFLPPRMTKAQRDLITDPAEGLIVYCNNCECKGFHFYNGTAWREFNCETTASFNFNCNVAPEIDRPFNLNTAEVLNVAVQITGVTTGNITLDSFSGNGFNISSQSIPIVANLTQTIIIPVLYNGTGAVGDYSITLTSDNGLNNCLINVSVIEFDGLTASGAAPGCKELLDQYPTISNGVYWIDTDGLNTGASPFQCNCDMENGGWTLLDGFSDNDNLSTYTHAIGNVNISNSTELTNSGYIFQSDLTYNSPNYNLIEYLTFYKGGTQRGAIKRKMVVGFNEVRVLFGSTNGSIVNVLKNTSVVSTLTGSGVMVYESTVNSADFITLEELGFGVAAINSIWVR